MTRPDSLFEAASYDLNKFIERRATERRFEQRDALDRRQPVAISASLQVPDLTESVDSSSEVKIH